MNKNEIGYYENAIALYRVTGSNNSRLAGFDFERMETSPEGWDVFIYYNPYRKLKADLVNAFGTLYLSSYYGETMSREDIFYVIIPETESYKF